MTTPRSSIGYGFPRRNFLGAAAALAVGTQLGSIRAATESQGTESENLVVKLYESLSDTQKQEICFDWDYRDDRGVLRTHVANNWQITDPKVASQFYTKDQQELIEAIFWGLYNQEWHGRIRKQLLDDAGGYGKEQSIALFGTPGKGPFEFVMTGRHLTIRCDGNSVEHAAFGGPIFYGHAAQDFNESPLHEDNVYWHQAVKANGLFAMLDGKQRGKALIQRTVGESTIHFRNGKSALTGLPLADCSPDQLRHAEEVLASLVEPYRATDQAEVAKCLAAQGGLKACHLSFYADTDLGNDGVYDVWRLEGPAFVWHYRGNPHVHVWVNVADNPNFEITARG